MPDLLLSSAGTLAQTAPVVSEIAWFAVIACACRYLKNRRAATLLAVGVLSFVTGWAIRLLSDCGKLPGELIAGSDLAIALSFILMLVSIVYLVRIGWQTAHLLKFEAESDPLTGAYNRRYFLRALQAALAEAEEGFAVAIIDIDNMKEINDNFGHHKGDEVLQRVARALREGVRQTDVVARLGGDEFGVIFRKANGDTRVLLERLRKQLDTSGVAASFGLASCPQDGKEIEKLLAVADARMYRQKKARKNRAARGGAGELKNPVLLTAAR
jgi:diguanylate cyclase (GGDEF)-like protein